ncbi:MAG: hypothetical protein J7K40_06330 [candidate division Zixibacteria bacterium]|nr:hypothetical protein [candidate division Zixibacteria bacterium]
MTNLWIPNQVGNDADGVGNDAGSVGMTRTVFGMTSLYSIRLRRTKGRTVVNSTAKSGLK